jgi:hypothetical protein
MVARHNIKPTSGNDTSSDLSRQLIAQNYAARLSEFVRNVLAHESQ